MALFLDRDGGDAVIRIRDTGIGIEAADLPRVFEMFVQTDAPLESRSGLGIGLTLAKSLVERHDGRLTIESEGRGRGTEAIVRLPALITPSSKRLEDDRDAANVRRHAGTEARTGRR